MDVTDLVDVGDGEDEDLFDGAVEASESDTKFDLIVGVLESIVMDPSFRSQHEAFCRTNCQVFENTEENKLVYTTLFQQYTELTETYIETRLKEEIEGFSMEEFSAMLESRPDEISGDLFDLLLGFGDFDEFKSLMLSYKDQFFPSAGSSMVSLAPTVIHIGDGPEVAVSGFGGAGGVEAAGATPLEGFVALSIGGLGQAAGIESSQSGGQAAGESSGSTSVPPGTSSAEGTM